MAGMRISARMAGDVADIKILMNHPMETGLRKDANGQLVPAHHITNVTASVGGKVVMDAQCGGGLSKNPFFNIKVKGAKAGDKVVVETIDNKGEKDSGTSDIVAG